MRLGEAGNTHSIALFEIEKRGYEIIFEYDEAEDWGQWLAKNADNTIYASCPLTLLALVVIADNYGENWRDIDTGGIYDRVLSKD